MKYLIFTILILFASNSFAQTETAILTEPPPGNIKMLPGYVHKIGRRTDSIDGTISKENGIEIYYDIGWTAGNYALGAYKRDKKKLVWFRKQKNNGLKVMITYLTNGQIYATFPKTRASFMANVKTEAELTDFLTMIMTYGARDKE
jgi:hypothetical protein